MPLFHGDLGGVPQGDLGLVAEGRDLPGDLDNLAVERRQGLEIHPVPAADIAGKGCVFALAIEIDIDLAGAHEGQRGAPAYGNRLSDMTDRIPAGDRRG